MQAPAKADTDFQLYASAVRASIADVVGIITPQSRVLMAARGKAPPGKDRAKTVHRSLVSSANEYNRLFARFAVNGEDADALLHQSQTPRFIESGTRDVKMAVACDLDSFERVEVHVVRSDCVGQFGGTGLNGTSMWSHDYN
jgi:hypothetical protein